MTPDMTCQELVELVTDYLEGALPPAERRRVDAHLATCDACRIYLDQMRQTIRALGALPAEEVSPEALQALLEAFRHSR